MEPESSSHRLRDVRMVVVNASQMAVATRERRERPAFFGLDFVFTPAPPASDLRPILGAARTTALPTETMNLVPIYLGQPQIRTRYSTSYVQRPVLGCMIRYLRQQRMVQELRSQMWIQPRLIGLPSHRPGIPPSIAELLRRTGRPDRAGSGVGTVARKRLDFRMINFQIRQKGVPLCPESDVRP